MPSLAPGRPQHFQPLAAAPVSGGVLSRLLFERALTRPRDRAFRDGPGREAWSDRPALELTFEVAAEAVRRLSSFLRGLGLDAGSPVGVWLPNGSEAALSILAIDDAGLTPCLIDITSTAGELSGAIQAADLRALITQSRLGPDRLAQKACFVAAGFFRLRYLLAFGPDVPDGVVDLDPILLTPRSAEPQPNEPASPKAAGIITLERGRKGHVPVHWPASSLLCAAALLTREAKIEPAHCVITFCPPDDLLGLAAGLLAALVAGATLEAHCAFRTDALLAALARDGPTHLVIPGSLESAFAEADLFSRLASSILLHRAPVSFGARSETPQSLVDVLSFGEVGFLAAARTEPGRFGMALPRGEVGGMPGFLEAWVKDDDAICVRGPGCAVQDGTGGPSDEWRLSGFRAERSEDCITAVSSVGQ